LGLPTHADDADNPDLCRCPLGDGRCDAGREREI
jgi:hypothetical protein